MTTLSLKLATPGLLDWAQRQWTERHYRQAPIDTRCSVLAYIVMLDGHTMVGALGFGRPESTRCYDGLLTYGSLDDVASGRARYSYWEIINLARVWLDPVIQAGGELYVPNAATWVIGAALKRVVLDYLAIYPPCFLDEPWRLRQVISYCDTKVHQGTIYRAAGFELARTNKDGIETWMRPLRGLQGHERQQIERIAGQSFRSRSYRSQRAATERQMEMSL